MIPSQKVAPTSVMTDVSSCTVYQYPIVTRVDVSTVTSCPYTPLTVYKQFLHSLSHPRIRTTQKLITTQVLTDIHKWAHSCEYKCTNILYMYSESYIYFLLIQMLISHFDCVCVDLVARSPAIISSFIFMW